MVSSKPSTSRVKLALPLLLWLYYSRYEFDKHKKNPTLRIYIAC